MEITRHNFRQHLPHLEQVVREAQFFAIDTEFTGLNFSDGTTPFDTPGEYYAKMQENTSGYIIVQFGITAFFVVPNDDDAAAAASEAGGSSSSSAASAQSEQFTGVTSGKSTAAGNRPQFRYESFNFYLTPRAKRQSFRCQGESMAFLASHNFDFNKLFRDGISYCDLIEANEMRQKFRERVAANASAVAGNAYASEVTMTVPKEELETLQAVRQTVQEFLRSEQDEITVEHCNAFRRKLVYQLLEEEFADTVMATARKLPNSSIKVIQIRRKKSGAEENQLAVLKQEQELTEIEDAIGFTGFLKMVSDSKKLIVGHNMFLDVLYSMRQFVAPAADVLGDFKRVTHKMFPAILDTKYMCSQENIKAKIPSSALSDIFEVVSKKPFVLPDIQPVAGGYSYANIDGQVHDAGYDSFMTGVSFISMAMHLRIPANDLQARSPKLQNLINKLYVMRLADICFIDLTGKEPQPKRDHVFYVSCPEHWKHPNIMQMFRQFGSVHSSWLGLGACYVSLIARENAGAVMRLCRPPDGVTIERFDEYLARTQSAAAVAAKQPSSSEQLDTATLGGAMCRTPVKRRSNGRPTAGTAAAEVEIGDAATPTTTVHEARLDALSAGIVDASISESKKEQKLTKKLKLKTRTTDQTVFQTNDDWD